MNADKIITVKYATYTVSKRMLEKLQACRDLDLDLCGTGATLFGSW